jgi:hypothetical protein
VAGGGAEGLVGSSRAERRTGESVPPILRLLFSSSHDALGRGKVHANVFKVKILRENEVILLIDVWIYIYIYHVNSRLLRRFISEGTPQIKAVE